jgi:hypothetical protein
MAAQTKLIIGSPCEEIPPLMVLELNLLVFVKSLRILHVAYNAVVIGGRPAYVIRRHLE